MNIKNCITKSTKLFDKSEIKLNRNEKVDVIAGFETVT